MLENVAVLSQGLFVLLTRQNQEPGHDAVRAPAPIQGEAPSRSLVPTDLALEGTEVIDHGLDLDDDQRARSSIEREQIDPATPPTIDDGHFAGRLPASPTKPTIDVSRAAGMYGVALPAIADDHWRSKIHIQLKAKRSGDPNDQLERRICPARLDGGDVRPGNPDR